METATERITAERFLELVEEGEFAHRWVELVDGELVVNEPLPIHAALQVRIVTELEIWIRAGKQRGLVLTPADVVMDAFNVYGPDVLWFAEHHRPADLRQRLPGVPDLCVEIRSPSTWRFDIGAKKRVYEAGGLPELWLVDTVAEQIFVFRRSKPRAGHFDIALDLNRGDTLASPLLRDFALSLDELFRVAELRD
jgi:Uma2 family endonuclease